MKEKVRQQEDDVNAENPVVFMEAQSASKQEVIKRLNHFTSGSQNFPRPPHSEFMIITLSIPNYMPRKTSFLIKIGWKTRIAG